MKVTVIISTNETEKVWNALRLTNAFLGTGHEVSIFLMNSGVEAEFIDHELFDIQKNWQVFLERGGNIVSCGTCLQFRKLTDKVSISKIGNLLDCATMVETADKVLNF